MALGQKNKVKVAIESYVHLIIGEKKIGKTTLVAEIAKSRGSLDKLLSISVGDEDGFHAIDGLIYENPMTWKEFVAIVDELIQKPEENDFDYVAIDTIDELVSIAIKEVLRQHKIDKGTEAKSLNDAFGGYGRGRDKLMSLIGDQLSRLKKSKYTVFLIGHNKLKEIKDKVNDPYSMLTSNLNADQYNIFSYKADIICNIMSEKEVGENGNLVGVNRYMHFRSDGFVDAGSRFAELPSKVPYGADEYIEAVEEGIKNSLNREVSDKEMEKLKKESIKEKHEKAKEFAEKEIAHEQEEEMEEEVNELISYISDNIKKISPETKEKLKVEVKTLGTGKKLTDATIKDIDMLRKCKNMIDGDLNGEG